MKGRIADCDAPPPPNSGGGPAPHYREGGRTRAEAWCAGGKVGPRLDRAGRKRGGHIGAAARRALPSSDFALPGKGEGPQGKGSGAYPIDTEGRARSALSRASANASSAEQATIRAKVRAKYPDIKVTRD